MPQLPNVLVAMQSIQRDIEEVLANLDVLKGSSPEIDVGLDRCIATLNNTWRTANDYEAQLPAFATPFNAKEN